MPISYNGKEYEFQELVNHIKKTKPEISSPGGYVKNIEKKQSKENLQTPNTRKSNTLQSTQGENEEKWNSSDKKDIADKNDRFINNVEDKDWKDLHPDVKKDLKNTSDYTDEEDEIDYNGETYRLAPKGHKASENDLDFEGKIYTKKEGEEELDTLAPDTQTIDVEPKVEGEEEVSGPPADSTMPANFYKKTEEVLVKVGEKLIKVPVYEAYTDPKTKKLENLKNKGNKVEGDFKKKDLTHKGNEANGNCDFCMGSGKVIVEKVGLKDCPRCDGDGEIKNNKFQEDNQFKEEPENDEQSTDKYREEIGESCSTCPIKLKRYTDYIFGHISALKNQAVGNETVGLLFGNEIETEGKKIKGTLAYAGFSLNKRIYSPEELAKGHGMTVPLIINHASTIGAEQEIAGGRIPEEVVKALEQWEDYVVGEVTLNWDDTTLTLSYEGVITDEFWQGEVDDAEMAVSLGIYYDADSPQLCNEKCYTVIQGAEFREVSLVYHPGFPIATIEAVESYLKEKAIEYGNSDLLKRKERAFEMAAHREPVKINGIKSFIVGNESSSQTFEFDNTGWIILADSNEALKPVFNISKATEDGLPDVKKPTVKKPENT